MIRGNAPLSELAHPSQLRAARWRWALFLVPLVVLLGFVSGQLAGSAADNPWFEALKKPEFYPPSIAFPIAWTVLYAMMGLALALVVSARGARGRGAAIVAFVVQLILNLAWTPLFFGAHQITLSLGLLLLLDLAVLLTILLFARVRGIAAWLMVPYLIWLLFATYLNYEVHMLNPGADGQQVSGAVTRVPL
jgi:tryptophan-rich sensory protein